MPDYNRYRREKGLSNNDMISCLHPNYSKFQKATMTMINNPDDYAVQLLPEAEMLLKKKFGFGKGLSICDRPRSSHGNSKKPNRLYVRVDDSLMDRVKTLMSRMHFATTQDFVEAALLQMVEKYGG
jgi:hypothetical protein